MLNDKNVLIVGGSSGIGLAIADYFNQQQANVIVASNEKGQGKSFEYFADNGRWIDADVETQSGPKELIEEAWAKFGQGPIDSLVYVAGVYIPDGLSSDDPVAVWNKTYNIKVRGSYLAALEYARCLQEQDAESEDPNILFVSSINAIQSEPEHLAYDGACAAVEGQTRSFAVQFAQIGIRVNCLAPGLVATRLTQEVVDDEHLHQHAKKCIPLGRIGLTTDFGPPAAFLCDGQQSGYITGEVLRVDGGIAALQAPNP